MTAPQLQLALLLAAAGLVGVVGLVVVLPRPKVAVTALFCCLVFVPSWMLGDVIKVVSLHVMAAAVCLVSLIAAIYRDHHAKGVALPSFHLADLAVSLVLALALIGVVAKVVDTRLFYDTSVWVLMYLVGRLAVHHLGLEFVTTLVAIVFTIVALFAIVEFITGKNLWLMYTGNSTGAFAQWGAQQYRGSTVRVEAAFGHSIALGACLAIAAILTAASRLRTWLKVAAIGVIGVALIFTFSRTAFVTIGIGMFLIIVRSGRSITRPLRVALGLIAVASVPLAVLVTSDAFSENTDVSTNSALYRLWLWDLLPGVKPFGASDLIRRATDGTVTIGTFGSIDSAVLLHALTAGWIPTVLLCIALLGATIRLLVRGGDVALIVVVSLIPSFFTVALIEQYAHLTWLVAGVAVTGLAAWQRAPDAAAAGLARAEPVRSLAGVA